MSEFYCPTCRRVNPEIDLAGLGPVATPVRCKWCGTPLLVRNKQPRWCGA